LAPSRAPGARRSPPLCSPAEKYDFTEGASDSEGEEGSAGEEQSEEEAEEEAEADEEEDEEDDEGAPLERLHVHATTRALSTSLRRPMYLSFCACR
jgi:hypothetical protein